MTILPLAQWCPCSGSGGSDVVGFSPFAWLTLFVLAFCLWQAFKWTKATWGVQGSGTPQKLAKVGLHLVLLGMMAAVVVGQFRAADDRADGQAGGTATYPTQGLPVLLDLGSKSCMPCKMMEPILEELKKEYAGTFDVEFIDVGLRENADTARRYGVESIPTQIYFSEEGAELWRHEGFLSKDEILAQWKTLGYTFSVEATTKPRP